MFENVIKMFIKYQTMEIPCSWMMSCFLIMDRMLVCRYHSSITHYSVMCTMPLLLRISCDLTSTTAQC